MLVNKIRWLNGACLDTIIRKLMLIFVLLIISASSFSGYFSQNAFLDDYEPQYNYRRTFTKAMDGTATRPFVYRQFIPFFTKETSEVIPKSLYQKIEDKWQNNSPVEKIYAKSDIPTKYVVEYHVMYVLCFVFWTLAIFMMYKTLSLVTENKLAGILGACLFAMVFPVLEINGGEYYDLPEVFFFATSIYFAIRGYWIAFIILAPIATTNKESFFFFLITLYPFIRESCSMKKAIFILGVSMFFSGLTYLYLHILYSGNAGNTVEFHLIQHLEQLFWWKTYVRTTIAYGIKFGGGTFFLHIIFIFWIVKVTWKNLSVQWKRHMELALLITVPLYMCFCAVGETRNFSMLYVGVCVMIAYFIRQSIDKYYRKDMGRIADKNE